jgi:hypothetical protein
MISLLVVVAIDFGWAMPLLGVSGENGEHQDEKEKPGDLQYDDVSRRQHAPEEPRLESHSPDDHEDWRDAHLIGDATE